MYSSPFRLRTSCFTRAAAAASIVSRNCGADTASSSPVRVMVAVPSAIVSVTVKAMISLLQWLAGRRPAVSRVGGRRSAPDEDADRAPAEQEAPLVAQARLVAEFPAI